MLQTESSKIRMVNENRLCDVVPIFNKVPAITNTAVAIAT